MVAVTGWVRVFFLILDVIYWLLGLFLLGLIFGFLANNETLRTNFETGFAYFTYVVLSAGLYIFFTGIWGLIAGIRENTCMLITFIVMVIVLMMAELSGGIAAATIGETSLIEFRYSVWLDFSSDAKGHIQQKLQCCGFITHTEYTATITDLPTTCFVPGTTPTAANQYNAGCWERVHSWLYSSDGLATWIGTLLGVVLLQVLLIIFAILIVVRRRRVYRGGAPPPRKRRPVSDKATVGGKKKKPPPAVVALPAKHYSSNNRVSPEHPSSTKPQKGTRRDEREHYEPYVAPAPRPRPLQQRQRQPSPPPPRQPPVLAPAPAAKAWSPKHVERAPTPPPVRNATQPSSNRGYDSDYIRQYKPVNY